MRTSGMLTGLILGAGAMYFLDPQQGRRRRALVEDQLQRLGHDVPHALDVAWRDLSNRAQGTVAELRHLIETDDASDAVLCQRVRSKAGRYVSHPAALEVDAADGCIVLRGPVLRHEVDNLIEAVRSVRGVCDVTDELDVHDTTGDHPALQGGARPAGEPWELWQGNWTPAGRLLAGTLGLLMMTSCMRSRSLFSPLWGVAGFGLFARSLANLDWGRTLGVAGGRRGIDVQKTIEIAAPVERVFEFFSHLENYRRISDKVIDVQSHGDGRYTKEMLIGGVPVHFEERITRVVPNEILRSRSEPGSVLAYMKDFRFERIGDNRTRVNVLFSYSPPGGVVAHAVAGVLGFDPKTLLEEILVRAKSFLETGREPHDVKGKSAAAAGSSGNRQSPPAGDVWTGGRQ